MVKVGILGASGYAGLELVRLVLGHPRLELAWVGAHSEAGKRLDAIDPRAPALELLPTDQCNLAVEAVFSCLPHAASQEPVWRAHQAGAVVIDLSADFRLSDPAVYERVYETPHRYPDLLAQAVYGLTEVARPKLEGARMVANPGCYPTSVLLALEPVRDRLSGTIIVDSKSGVSGAGRGLSRTTHFVDVHDNLTPYKIGDCHRHRAEMCEHIGHQNLLFTPHLLPVTRGILSVLYVPWNGDFDPHALYQERYAGEPFVRVLAPGQTANLAQVVGSNRCHLSLHPTASHLIVVSTIDNLIKGAAGQALQNLNAVLGFEETEGLAGW